MNNLVMLDWELTHDNALETNIAHVKESGKNAEDVHDLAFVEEQHFHGRTNAGELIGVVSSFTSCTFPLFWWL